MTTARTAASVVAVAPREIRDLVDRCCRITGCDAGTAAMIAERVTAAQIASGDAVASFLASFDAGDPLPAPGADAHTVAVPGEQRLRAAARDGVPLDRALLDALEARAAAFLVPEALLDQLTHAD